MKLRRVRWLAELLDVTPHRAYAILRELEIPGVVRIGRQVRLHEEAVLEWLRNGGQALDGGWRREADGDAGAQRAGGAA